MPKVPRQRKPGGRGGLGGHGKNMHNAQKRDSRPIGRFPVRALVLTVLAVAGILVLVTVIL
jgi:hypothetical protein